MNTWTEVPGVGTGLEWRESGRWDWRASVMTSEREAGVTIGTQISNLSGIINSGPPK